MDFGTVSGLFSLLLIIVFIGIVVWAYSSKRRRDFDEAARLPLEEDDRKAAPDERTRNDGKNGS